MGACRHTDNPTNNYWFPEHSGNVSFWFPEHSGNLSFWFPEHSGMLVFGSQNVIFYGLFLVSQESFLMEIEP